MIDYPITEVVKPITMGVREHRALYRLVRGYPLSKDRVVLAEAIERNIARRKERESAGERLALFVDNYPDAE